MSEATRASQPKPKKSSSKKKLHDLALALPPPRSCLSSSETFAQFLLKKSLGSLCMSLGVHFADAGAFEALVEVSEQRLLKLGEDLKQRAEHSQRKHVTLEDFSQICKIPKSTQLTIEPIQAILNVPKFPVDSNGTSFALSTSVVEESDQPTSSRLPHFPPFPPARTYKRTKLEPPALPSITELRRIQQRHSALVRESLAKMQREMNSSTLKIQTENNSIEHSSE